MAAVDPARERVARMLHEAVTRLHEDIERVEFWTEVLGCLTRPVPDYTPENSKLNRFNVPLGLHQVRRSSLVFAARKFRKAGSIGTLIPGIF